MLFYSLEILNIYLRPKPLIINTSYVVLSAVTNVQECDLREWMRWMEVFGLIKELLRVSWTSLRLTRLFSFFLTWNNIILCNYLY